MSLRSAERRSAAALRAVACNTDADIRGTRLEVDGRPYAVVVPYLALDLAEAGLDRRRGVIDALALRLKHSDRRVHLELSPTAPLERIVFDIAEQFRCESLAEDVLRGVRRNSAAAFDEWSETARGERIAETGVGLLVYTITHMLRSRLLRVPTTETIDDIIEVTRGNLGRLVGHALRAMPALVGSQRDFAEPAREIARLVAEMAGDAGESLDASPAAVARHRLLIPIDWETLGEELAAAEASGNPSPIDADYHVYTTEFDVELAGRDLYREPALRGLRRQLDEQVAAQAVSITRLAQRLQRLFPAVAEDGWTSGDIDGVLDPRRLTRIVVDPSDPHIRRTPRVRPSTDAVVSFLIDTSGSMKLQRYETVAVLVDTLARALELAGVATEVLGFSTSSWAGGRAIDRWRRDGAAPDPGRVSELCHIVYKSADVSWRHSRLSIAAMMRTDHYREGVDGEALAWAAERLARRPEHQRALVMISDGIPMEAATAGANRPFFLDDHLRAVAGAVETDRTIQLGAIGIDHQLDDYVANSISMDLTGTLTIGDYGVLHRLFG